MKNNMMILCAGVALMTLGAADKAQAGRRIDVVGGAYGVSVSAQFDTLGFPIWGYIGGRPVYAYTPGGVPIYRIDGIYRGCYVPTWDPRPGYRGPRWPAGICRGHYPPPVPPGHVRPMPPPGHAKPMPPPGHAKPMPPSRGPRR